MSKYERDRLCVVEAESSCATRQSTIFEFMDPKKYNESMTDSIDYFIPHPEIHPLGGRIIPW